MNNFFFFLNILTFIFGFSFQIISPKRNATEYLELGLKNVAVEIGNRLIAHAYCMPCYNLKRQRGLLLITILFFLYVIQDPTEVPLISNK